jgi:Protein of unknown function (DUF4231)
VAPDTTSVAYERLEDQIGWYDRKSLQNQRRFKLCKYVEILAAAAIPVLAGAGSPAMVVGSLGGVVLVLEGIQHLNQYQQNWIAYRSTAEALKHEKYLYAARAAHYAVPHAHRLLAERIEGLVSQEHAKWVSAREDTARAGEHEQAG